MNLVIISFTIISYILAAANKLFKSTFYSGNYLYLFNRINEIRIRNGGMMKKIIFYIFPLIVR